MEIHMRGRHVSLVTIRSIVDVVFFGILGGGGCAVIRAIGVLIRWRRMRLKKGQRPWLFGGCCGCLDNEAARSRDDDGLLPGKPPSSAAVWDAPSLDLGVSEVGGGMGCPFLGPWSFQGQRMYGTPLPWTVELQNLAIIMDTSSTSILGSVRLDM
jgi:hypothetical protein